MEASSYRGFFSSAVYLIGYLTRGVLTTNDDCGSSQEENIFLLIAGEDGFVFTQPSMILQERKLYLMKRALNSSDIWTHWAMEALLRRFRSCFYKLISVLTIGVSSLLAYKASGRAILTHLN